MLDFGLIAITSSLDFNFTMCKFQVVNYLANFSLKSESSIWNRLAERNMDAKF